jgi:hypothetical protein
MATIATGVSRRADASLLRRWLEESGGCTLASGSDQRIRRGWAVGIEPGRALCFPSPEWDDVRVSSWIDDSADLFACSDIHLGTWHDRSTDLVWLESVSVVPAHDRLLAEQIGRRHRQVAIFDLGRRRLVMLVAVQQRRRA